MLVVVALGGNALLRRGEHTKPHRANQREDAARPAAASTGHIKLHRRGPAAHSALQQHCLARWKNGAGNYHDRSAMVLRRRPCSDRHITQSGLILQRKVRPPSTPSLRPGSGRGRRQPYRGARPQWRSHPLRASAPPRRRFSPTQGALALTLRCNTTTLSHHGTERRVAGRQVRTAGDDHGELHDWRCGGESLGGNRRVDESVPRVRR